MVSQIKKTVKIGTHIWDAESVGRSAGIPLPPDSFPNVFYGMQLTLKFGIYIL